MEVADRIVVMNKGVIEQIGSPGDVYENPASDFVYHFLGDSNRLLLSDDNHVLFRPTKCRCPDMNSKITMPLRCAIFAHWARRRG